MTTDTGFELRSLYAPEGGVGEIFSRKVAEYVASRPDYPDRLFEQLRTTGNLTAGATVADIGAGTGLLTRGLLTQGPPAHRYKVIAVEPNAAMRAAADQLLGALPGYTSMAGSAEHIPLPSGSVDLICAAQAFHWFEIDKTRAECLRVLRPAGKVALIWNDRVLTDPLHVALDDVFAEYGGAKRGALVAHESRNDVPTFFGATVPAGFSWPHEHQLDEQGLLSLVFSRSYMPERDSDSGRDASQRVRQLFHRFAEQGLLTVHYTTVAIIGRPERVRGDSTFHQT